MNGSTGSARTSWASWIVSGLIILFLLTDAIPKILKMDVAVDGSLDLGYPESVVAWIGGVLLISTILYALPRTAVLGAVLLTGYLGGAIATQVRLEDWWLLFPAVLAILVWVGLVMRQPRLQQALLAPM